MSKLLIHLTKGSPGVSNVNKKQSDNEQLDVGLFNLQNLSEKKLKKSSNERLNLSRPPKPPIVNSEGHSDYSTTSLSNRSNSQSSHNDEIIIKEEVNNDCIYQVQIKKVYNKNMLDNEPVCTNKIQTGAHWPLTNLSTSFFQSYMDETSTTNRSNDGLVYTKIKIKQLKFASLRKFVDHLLNQQSGEMDLDLVATFLATYRTFSDGIEITKEFRRLYEQVLPASLDMTEEVRLDNLKSIRSICMMWLSNYNEDFNEPPEYFNLRELKKFADTYFDDNESLRKNIKEKLEQFKFENSSKSSSSNHKRSQSSLTRSSLTNFNSLISLEEKFMSIESAYFAEQLTYVDKSLFQKVCAHHCLGAVWSTRYQKTVKQNTLSNLTASTNSVNEKFASIKAFIDQFNCLSFFVQATILEKIDLEPDERANIISKWIEIAKGCKKYKNYSSLNAIVQGLNTQCVSRLQKTWDKVPFDLKQTFIEMTEIFSQEQNQKLFRDILMQELKYYMVYFESNETNDINYDNILNKTDQNVSKNAIRFKLNNKYVDYELDDSGTYADINSGINATLSRKMREKIFMPKRKKKLSESLGIVPFLGTFLKDLEYIHAQMPTKTDQGLINVFKKRKEFEIIAQIKLFQKASHLYKINHDPNFNIWLHKQPVYSERQNYDFSYKIEPKSDPTNYSKDYCLGKTKINSSHGSRSESVESVKSLSAKTRSSGFYLNDLDPVTVHSRNSSGVNSELLKLKLDIPSSSSLSNLGNSDQTCSSNFLDMSNNNSLTVNNKYNNKSTDIRVKVNIELSDLNKNFKKNEQISSVIYKSLLITDKYRTKDVKRLILEKFFLNQDLCDQFSLVQILSNDNKTSSSQTTNELVINDNCNVFYAAKSVPNMQFVLRKRLNSVKLNGNLVNDANQFTYLSAQNHKIISQLSP